MNFETKHAVDLMLFREHNGEREVLLQKRMNTGYGDGMWDFGCSGHVEDGESMTQALCREASEELGIHILPSDLRFVCLLHHLKPEGTLAYYDGYFTAAQFSGEPRVNEPDKCEEIRWFPLSGLPGSLLPHRREALHNYLHGVAYGEAGWSNQERE